MSLGLDFQSIYRAEFGIARRNQIASGCYLRCSTPFLTKFIYPFMAPWEDRESWFYNKSLLYQTYDSLPCMKPGDNVERLRWILGMAREMGRPPISQDI